MESQLNKLQDDCVNKIYLEKNYASNESVQSQIQVLESQLNKLQESCLKLDSMGACWDAKGYKISHVGVGEQLTDASVLSQSCQYDDRLRIFKCGNRTFNLVEKDDRNVERPIFRTVYQPHS